MRWLLQPYLRGLAPRWGARPSDAVFRWSFPLGPDDHRLPSTNPPGWPPAVSSAKNVPTPVPPEGGVPGAVPDAPKGVRIDSHPGGAAANRIRPFSEFGVTADNKAGRLRHSLFPICEYLRHLRLRNSDFGLLSGFGLRSSDFRAAEPDLPSTGRTLEQPCTSGCLARRIGVHLRLSVVVPPHGFALAFGVVSQIASAGPMKLAGLLNTLALVMVRADLATAAAPAAASGWHQVAAIGFA